MSNITETLKSIPNGNHTITINFLNSNDQNLNNYTIPQDDCHAKLKNLMRFIQSKYEQKKYKLFKLGDLYLEVDDQGKKKCFSNKYYGSYVEDKMLINVVNREELDVFNFPNLREYYSVVYMKERIINYNGIEASFIEERGPNSTINYIELRFKNSNEDIIDSLADVISIIRK